MATFISRSPEDTFRLGESWGEEAQPGWIVGLSGGLGAGKTQLVKGIAHGLGVRERISSPTFALVNEYTTGRLPLFHLDLYRLDDPAQVAGAGLEPYLRETVGVTVVEWIERWLEPEASLPGLGRGCFRRVWIDTLSETERRIRHEDSGR